LDPRFEGFLRDTEALERNNWFSYLFGESALSSIIIITITITIIIINIIITIIIIRQPLQGHQACEDEVHHSTHLPILQSNIRDEPCNKRVWMSRAGLAESDPSKEKLKVTRRRVTFRICRLLLRQTPLPQDRMLEIK